MKMSHFTFELRLNKQFLLINQKNIPEEEAFAIFVQIMQKYSLRDIYKPNMYHLGLCMFQLDHLLKVTRLVRSISFYYSICWTFECKKKESLPDLHSHFITHAFHTSMYSSSWFLTLFTTSLPLPLVCRIFDVFLNEVIRKITKKLVLNHFDPQILFWFKKRDLRLYFESV